MSFCAFMALDLDTSSAFHRNFLRCLAGPEPGCRDGSRFSLVLCPERFRFWSSTPRHDVFLTQLNSVKAFACAGAASASVWCIRSAFGAPGATWMQMAGAFWSAWSRIYRWVSISALPRNTSKLDLIVRIAETPHPPNGDRFGTSTVTLLQLFQSCKHSSCLVWRGCEGVIVICWKLGGQARRSLDEAVLQIVCGEDVAPRCYRGVTGKATFRTLWDTVLQMFLSIGVFVWCSLVILKDFGQFMLIHSLWNFTSQNKTLYMNLLIALFDLICRPIGLIIKL